MTCDLESLTQSPNRFCVMKMYPPYFFSCVLQMNFILDRQSFLYLDKQLRCKAIHHDFARLYFK